MPTRTSHDQRGFLGLIERIGNALPEPIFLFALFAAAVMAVSAVGSALGWRVQPLRPQVVVVESRRADGTVDRVPQLDTNGRPRIELVPSGDPITPRSLLTRDGVYWAVANMIRNFLNFPPLGVVLVGMLGIGVAEKVGLFGAAMKWTAGVMPSRLLTPTVVLLGVLSNMASDAGYIVLPPLAAGLYAVYGRSPVAGICAAFAGISGGFSANLALSPSDALMSELTTKGAQVLDANYVVRPTCNWTFMAVSTPFLTLVGWAVTSWVVERRFRHRSPEMGGPLIRIGGEAGVGLTDPERRGLRWALIALAAALAATGALLFIPGAPLHGAMPMKAPPYGPIPIGPSDWGASSPQPRWAQGVVPLIVLVFLAPGIAYGIATGSVRRAGDVGAAFTDSMRSMAPIIAVAFFAAQFLEYLRFSQLDRMIAFAGGEALVEAGLHSSALLLAVVALTLVLNIMISSMSAKWTMLSPILVPMLMMVGISPESCQLAYRVGDSVTNIVTPLNAYMLIVLAVLQRYWKGAGLGNMIGLMVPYTVAFTILWSVFLLAWLQLGLSPGPGAKLWYAPVH